ncbi:hypothetical protein FRB96_001375 [Tulasnella sp. 330]|nr:hypothetical protein FRB96_001375 [Tulasnella sp. 330]KAG8880022.1 hypothetical protein FRB97_001223 [Tulasnella sp. 331]
MPRISRLATLNPLAVSITWGAGGSSRVRSMELAGWSQAELGVDTILHLTCTNMEMGMVDEALHAAKAKGIQNVLALRGDPPQGAESWMPTDTRFAHAVDLVRYIRSRAEFADHFCIGVAAYPDGHTDGLPVEQEMTYLKEKVDAGADFIVTQLFYDVANFKSWVNKIRSLGIVVPIVPGIMPIQNYTSFLRLTKLCGTNVPREVWSKLEPIRNDDQKVKDYGVELAISIVNSVISDNEIDVLGVHLCTLNLEKSVRRVLDGLGWSHESHRMSNQVIDETPAVHHLPSDALISPADASTSAMTTLLHPPSSPSLVPLTDPAKPLGTGVGTTWDEFPNGRFGDPTSPAYGVGSGDQWDPGAGGLGVTRLKAISQWGSPETLEDLIVVFVRYLQSDPRTPTTPFSPDPLLDESKLVLPHLLEMTKRGWFTVGSQPAVDGAPSTDRTFGWGPAGGYVFQKAFVEFFCDDKTLQALQQRIDSEASSGWITWFATNVQDDFFTNVQEDGPNAVTWGVFPGQEIAQSTIIERTSFMTWKEEAYGIWAQWASLHPPASKTRKLLEEVRDNRWLVSVVHHDFKDEAALWSFLLEQ